MASFKEILFNFQRRPVGLITGGISSLIKTEMHWFGLPISAVLLALLSQWDHKFEQEKLLDEYLPEIAARRNKKPETLTRDDLKAEAEFNPTLAEAMRRNDRRRNLSVVVTTIAMVAAFAFSSMVMPWLFPALFTGAKLTALITAGISGFTAFMASDYALETAGEKILALKEPTLLEVSQNPSLQPQLSLPSQIRYLETLQNQRTPISPEQIKTVMLAANPDRTEFGDLAQTAELLNQRRMRVQELAYLVHGQNSGLARLDAPQYTMMEKAQVEYAKQIAIAREKAANVTQQAKEKMAFAKSKISSAVAEKFSRKPERSFTERYEAERATQVQIGR